MEADAREVVGEANATRAHDGMCGEPTYCVATAGNNLPDSPPDSSHFLYEDAPEPRREDLLPVPQIQERPL